MIIQNTTLTNNGGVFLFCFVLFPDIDFKLFVSINGFSSAFFFPPPPRTSLNSFRLLIFTPSFMIHITHTHTIFTPELLLWDLYDGYKV
ncbi:hypothetical protein QVD17_05188 [Tagetes erecta]|uniref:Uncharacterized protein n=1 Tax=Tagetes erecta TaxID=13708 RepID=A0AAD8LHQ7_TARER|nr:hypothetical protein QVD17_05188 [Tagetes erecta]